METKPDPRRCDCGATIEPAELGCEWVQLQVCAPCADREFWRAREQESRGRARAARLENATLPPRHVRYLAGDGRPYAEEARRWLGDLDGGRGLYLFGAPGGGKTLRAVALALAALESDRTARYWTEAGFLADLRAGCARQAVPDAAELLRRACTVDVLVLDDLGTVRHRTDAYEDWLHTVIMTRYDDERSTVWTGNHQLEALDPYLTGRATRRIRETCRQVLCRPLGRSS